MTRLWPRLRNVDGMTIFVPLVAGRCCRLKGIAARLKCMLSNCEAPARVNYVAKVAIFILSAGLSTSCAEVAGSGRSMQIPSVRISCTTTNCRNAAQADAYVVYTTSGCTNPDFGERAAGSLRLTCNTIGCAGTVSQFIDSNSQSVTFIAEGTYSVCVILDFNADYLGTAVSGDSRGELANAALTTGTSFADVSVFNDVP